MTDLEFELTTLSSSITCYTNEASQVSHNKCFFDSSYAWGPFLGPRV